MSFTTDSNLFLNEFILRWAKMSLFKLLLRMYFKWLVLLVSLKTLDLTLILNSFVFGLRKGYCQ